MSNRAFRFLLICCFVALQGMAPFIHAHAGAVHANHAGFLHRHQAVAHVEAAWHALAADAHGPEVAVATGLPKRCGAATVPADVPWGAAPHARWPAAAMHDPAADVSAPPAVPWAPPGHARPPALAPPVA